MAQQHYKKRLHRAFSLIELLVSILVIAILLALTTTAINGFRQRAQQAKNVSAIRNLLAASILYAQDNDGHMPAFGYAADGSRPLQTTRASLNLAAGPQLLLSTDWPAGRGNSDYLPSPDAFYGPFTPGFDAIRERGRFAEVNSLPTMGYVQYSLPGSEDANGVAPLSGIANDHLYHNDKPSMTPVYSDFVRDLYGTPFTGSKFTVVYLDGSVRTFPLEVINPLGVTLRIRTIAGMVN